MADSPSPRYDNAIAGIESGGNYGLLGPVTKGDRAYGKYQVMGSNVPQWTQEALGQSLTPDQFLASPQAQDAVFNYKFGQYVNKYGPEGAAKAWFAGERGMNNPNAKDVLGTSVADYGAKFMRNLGQPGSAPQPPMSIAPPVASPAAPQSMPAFPWSPQAQPAQASPQGSAPPSIDPSIFQAPQLTPPQIAYFRPAPFRRGFSFKG